MGNKDMLTKNEVIDIFKNGTEEEQLEIVYRTRYQEQPEPWKHFANFWSDKDVALTEFRKCILDGYIAEQEVEEKYLKPAVKHRVLSNYELDAYNPYHFMQGDTFIRKSSELDKPDGHIWAGIYRYSFDIKHTHKYVVLNKQDNCLYGPGVCYKKTHNADYIFLYQFEEKALYVYTLMDDGKARLALKQDLGGR